METNRFDTISRLFASRTSRRHAVAGGLGLAAASIGGRVLAQDATPQVATPAVDPDDPHPSADDAKSDPEFLFVQPFDSGTWAPKTGEDGVYTLTLTGAAANTVYFSDRPERIVGLSPTQDFLDGLGFTPANPPNAAVVTEGDGGQQDVLVIELFNPVYDPDTSTLTYDAKVLADYGEPSLAHLARQQTDYELPEAFGAGSLFIDDCAAGVGTCYQEINNELVVVGELQNVDCCWQSDASPQGCGPCDDDAWSRAHGKACAEAFPETCHYFSGDTPHGWNCLAWDIIC